nr:parvalbumin alpha-like [Salvelinus alpinus]
MAALKDFLKADDIQKALDAVKAEGSFDHKKFFALVGLKAMILTMFVLKSFAEDGRDLTDAETKAFLNAADKDGEERSASTSLKSWSMRCKEHL